jgi:putative peptide zinc metalloprotease protein
VTPTPAPRLPPLREEISLHPGPIQANGWPSWVLRDPVRNRFFKLDWAGFEILSRWHLADPAAIAAAVSAETTLELEEEDVLAVAQGLMGSHLLQALDAQATKRLVAAHKAAQHSWFNWLLHHYLFFRIPLVRPDRFLTRTAPYVGWAASARFRLVTVLALLAGLVMLAREWDKFTATFLDTFSLSGAASYGLALGAAKIIHELAHAYTAKRLGCRVPTMGAAFLVLWPVLYTDVNESWLLPRRRDRLAVAAAGVLSELTLAAWATLAWGLLGDGTLKQAAFVLATTTWISSVLINLSPFMRFDGYFLVMDALEMPNLHPRSFAVARWRLREMLFGLGEDAPEQFSKRQELALTAFAWGVWIYRLMLFLGIAALVYHFFIKLVGVLLFAVEIGWFVFKPIWGEVMEWKKRWGAIRNTKRSRVTAAGVGAVVLLAVLPWQSSVTAPALLRAGAHLPLYAPAPAQVIEVAALNHQAVKAGETLFRLTSPDVLHRRAQAERKIEALNADLGATGFDPSLQSRTQSIREELQGAIAERLGAERELERLTVTAPQDGMVTDLIPDLKPGQWVSAKEKLASILAGQHAIIVAYVAEDAVDRLSAGDKARFIPTIAGRGAITATITAVERTAIRHLDALPLSSLAGGPIALRPGDKTLTPEAALYRVRLDTAELFPLQEVTGTLHLDATGASALGTLWRNAVTLLVREGGV